jgi:hypothetical protein
MEFRLPAIVASAVKYLRKLLRNTVPGFVTASATAIACSEGNVTWSDDGVDAAVADGGNGTAVDAAPSDDGGNGTAVDATYPDGGSPPVDAASGDDGTAALMDSGGGTVATGGDAQGPDGHASCPPTTVSGDFVPFVDRVSAAMKSAGPPSSNALVVPTSAERDAFASTVLAVLAGDDVAACALPDSYRLLSFQDAKAGALRVVAEADAQGAPTPKRFWGTYAALANPQAAPSRAIAVEAPHPIFDTNTERQAADTFVQGRARLLLLAGAHRCADSATSGCSGTTTACGGGSAPYRVSDAAHSVALPFFEVHAAVSSQRPELVFLQLHGNAQSCPDALVSDSSGSWPAAGPAVQLASALAAAGASVGKCGAGYPTSSCDLCGTTNVEARISAGSSNACVTQGAAYGRFVHVEQQMTLRTTPTTGAPGYQKMIDAVLATFPPGP